MLNVYLTVDTEIWCPGWDNLDATFPGAFRKYVYGPTPRGDFALPATLSILREYGLPAVFFVEPLFSARFGIEPLREMVGLIVDAGQEVQLHLHTEWLDEVDVPGLPRVGQKIPAMAQLDEHDQAAVIAWGLARLAEAGAPAVNAFRAGSYGANQATLNALRQNGIFLDSSYNLGADVGVADMMPGERLVQPRVVDGLCIYPVSVLRLERQGAYRIAQVTALSFREMVAYLEQALADGWDSVVIVTHNFEMLSPDKQHVDRFVERRFRQLCQYLAQHSDRYRVRGFADAPGVDIQPQPSPPAANPLRAGQRHAEQAVRRFLYR
ncbi:MAG: polysaccharide deacetylase family protein [Gammaproteobacteria bacterium]|nr:polysaccharide deacetylase family protein [Gammaproteobacteria bacterium]